MEMKNGGMGFFDFQISISDGCIALLVCWYDYVSMLDVGMVEYPISMSTSGRPWSKEQPYCIESDRGVT